MAPAKILAVDDEPDFELLITQRFRRQIREREFEFRFARHARKRWPRSTPSPIST
jgi:adenylate cyclase